VPEPEEAVDDDNVRGKLRQHTLATVSAPFSPTTVSVTVMRVMRPPIARISAAASQLAMVEIHKGAERGGCD
jgi:hypothetical protein